MKVAVVGGGAAGFFLALTVKAQRPEAEVTILERGKRVLRKVAVSGGGRCNCTNTFEDVKDLQQVYPRGHRLMKRLMKGFSQRDAYNWFEQHGVRLTIQEDHCVFPASQDTPPPSSTASSQKPEDSASGYRQRRPSGIWTT